MAVKWLLIASARSPVVRSLKPGMSIEDFFGKQPMRWIAILYQDDGSLWAWASLAAAKSFFELVIARATEFL